MDTKYDAFRGLTPLEMAVRSSLLRQGCRVYRHGWPDFLVITPDDSQAFGVEVKRETDSLSPSQIEMHAVLRSIGLPVHVAKRGQFSVSKIMEEISRLEGRLALLRENLDSLIITGTLNNGAIYGDDHDIDVSLPVKVTRA